MTEAEEDISYYFQCFRLNFVMMTEININGIERLNNKGFTAWYKQESKEKSFFNSNKNLSKPGIYCWGFFHPKNNNLFIPYYVGDSTSSLSRRLSKHIIDITTYTGSNYRRLKEDYFYNINGLWFGNDPSFPLYLENPLPGEVNQKYLLDDKNWRKTATEDFDNKIFYWANKDFVKKHFKSNNIKHKVIQQNNREKEDVLRQGIIEGRFGFMYWTVDPSNEIINKIWDTVKGAKLEREFLEIFECFIKFSLKTKTGSNSISIEQMKKRIELFFGNGTKLICKPANNNVVNYFKNKCDSDNIIYII
jgi:hypothetical protein